MLLYLILVFFSTIHHWDFFLTLYKPMFHHEDTFDIAQQAPEEFLEKISKEQDFFVTYVDVEEKSKDDKFHCFVQLSTNPVTVCFGIGQSPQKAKMNSAANALQYLRIMTK